MSRLSAAAADLRARPRTLAAIGVLVALLLGALLWGVAAGSSSPPVAAAPSTGAAQAIPPAPPAIPTGDDVSRGRRDPFRGGPAGSVADGAPAETAGGPAPASAGPGAGDTGADTGTLGAGAGTGLAGGAVTTGSSSSGASGLGATITSLGGGSSSSETGGASGAGSSGGGAGPAAGPGAGGAGAPTGGAGPPNEAPQAPGEDPPSAARPSGPRWKVALLVGRRGDLDRRYHVGMDQPLPSRTRPVYRLRSVDARARTVAVAIPASARLGRADPRGVRCRIRDEHGCRLADVRLGYRFPVLYRRPGNTVFREYRLILVAAERGGRAVRRARSIDDAAASGR